MTSFDATIERVDDSCVNTLIGLTSSSTDQGGTSFKESLQAQLQADIFKKSTFSSKFFSTHDMFYRETDAELLKTMDDFSQAELLKTMEDSLHESLKPVWNCATTALENGLKPIWDRATKALDFELLRGPLEQMSTLVGPKSDGDVDVKSEVMKGVYDQLQLLTKAETLFYKTSASCLMELYRFCHLDGNERVSDEDFQVFNRLLQRLTQSGEATLTMPKGEAHGLTFAEGEVPLRITAIAPGSLATKGFLKPAVGMVLRTLKDTSKANGGFAAKAQDVPAAASAADVLALIESSGRPLALGFVMPEAAGAGAAAAPATAGGPVAQAQQEPEPEPRRPPCCPPPPPPPPVA